MNDRGPVADPDSGGLGYGRSLRLLKPQEFSAVFAARQVWRSARFALHFRENGLLRPRLGLVIPKKQARTAVLRNAIKRQAREAFRHKRSGLPALDLVLRLTQPVMACEKAALRMEIEALFDRLSESSQRVQPEAGAREGGPV